MLGAEEIREQILQVTSELRKLSAKKRESERKRREGERLLADMNIYTGDIRNGMDDFLSKARVYGAHLPGCFGEYYNGQLMKEIKEKRIFEEIDEMEMTKTNIRSGIFSLDDIIKDLMRKITEKNNWLQQLRDMAAALAEAAQDALGEGN